MISFQHMAHLVSNQLPLYSRWSIALLLILTGCKSPIDLDTPSVSTQIITPPNNRITPISISVEAWQTGRDSAGIPRRLRWAYEPFIQNIQVDTTGSSDGTPHRLWFDIDWRVPGYRVQDSTSVFRPGVFLSTSIFAVRLRMDSVRCGTRQNPQEPVPVILAGNPSLRSNSGSMTIPIFSLNTSGRIVQDTAMLYAGPRPSQLQADISWQLFIGNNAQNQTPPRPSQRYLRGLIRLNSMLQLYPVQWEATIILNY